LLGSGAPLRSTACFRRPQDSSDKGLVKRCGKFLIWYAKFWRNANAIEPPAGLNSGVQKPYLFRGAFFVENKGETRAVLGVQEALVFCTPGTVNGL